MIAAAVTLTTVHTGTGNTGHIRSKTGLQAAVHHHGVANSRLIRLADYVSNSATPSGDATLVARTTLTGGQTVTVYDLYADDGKYFFSQTASGMAGQVSAGNNRAGGLFAREVAAAKEAANGNVQQGAQDMADAPDPSRVVSRTQPTNMAMLEKKLALIDKHTPSAAEVKADASATDFNNYAWENSQDALIAGAGDPQVRAGVLHILATLPGVTVTQGTSDGQPTLVLTAGSPEMGYGYSEQLTINADTGVPVQFVGGVPGKAPATTVDYKVSRVDYPALAASDGSGE
ncbi:MAG: hypothetical protein ACRDMJ_16385 [Solirubrobacteraceae bacterium]